MIDAKELRIGNFAQSPVGWIGSVIELKSSFVRLYKKDDLSAYQFGSDLVEPIPLTPEWLERLGFKLFYTRINASIWDTPKYTEGFFVLMANGISFEITGEEGETYVFNVGPFVHQLQNFYKAIAGEELTLKELQP